MSLARSVGISLSVAIVVALALYPILVYTTLGRFGASGVAAVLAAVCAPRLIFARLLGHKALGGGYLEIVSAGGVMLAVASLWFDSAGAVLYYPVLVNAGLLLMFAASLVKPPTVIERIARLREPDLPPAAVRYTRRVTIAWTAFFVCNGAAALLHRAVHVARGVGAVQRPDRLHPHRRRVRDRARVSYGDEVQAESMRASRLAALLAGRTNHVVCFGRGGKEHRVSDLTAAAAGVAARLEAVDGERWALNLSDAFEFTAALMGCWAAGRTPLLAPPTALPTLARAALDGVIESAGEETAAPHRIVWEDIEAVRHPLGMISRTLHWCCTRRARRARRRKQAVGSPTWRTSSRYSRPSSARRSEPHASSRRFRPSSCYGLLFRILWPLLERRPFATFDYEYPEQLLGEVGNGNVLISSPALLKRVGHLPAHSGQWRAVFSSGGFLPADTPAAVARVLGAEPVEVLGSTETSGVAWRTRSSAGFRVLPSVEVRVCADELLEVRSPFAGDGWQAMGDRVRFRADGGFELLGRADRIAKIEDKRVSLPEIESRLLEHEYVKDVAAVALEDSTRQYIGVVIELSSRGRDALAARGKAAVNSTLRASLRAHVDAVALPRAFRYLAALPVDSQGKHRVAALLDLFVAS